jgi:uncharacterized membrane protein YhiD involved in acid resistance
MNKLRTVHLRQRGVTLIGLILAGIVVAFAALLVMRVFPSVNEYWTLKRVVAKIARDKPATVAQVRDAFERAKSVEYSISTVDSKDLEVTKEGDALVIRFSYDKVIDLVDPVFLLIKYKGEGRS